MPSICTTRRSSPIAAFPVSKAGRLPHQHFQGLLSVHCTLQPAGSRGHLRDPFHRRLQPFRHLHDRSDCYRLERKSPGGSVSHWVIAPFPRRTSRPAQASLALRPVGLLDRPRRPLSRGSDPDSYPSESPASYQTYRQLSGWNLPPLGDTYLRGARILSVLLFEKCRFLRSF